MAAGSVQPLSRTPRANRAADRGWARHKSRTAPSAIKLCCASRSVIDDRACARTSFASPTRPRLQNMFATRSIATRTRAASSPTSANAASSCSACPAPSPFIVNACARNHRAGRPLPAVAAAPASCAHKFRIPAPQGDARTVHEEPRFGWEVGLHGQYGRPKPGSGGARRPGECPRDSSAHAKSLQCSRPIAPDLAIQRMGKARAQALLIHGLHLHQPVLVLLDALDVPRVLPTHSM